MTEWTNATEGEETELTLEVLEEAKRLLEEMRPEHPNIETVMTKLENVDHALKLHGLNIFINELVPEDYLILVGAGSIVGFCHIPSGETILFTREYLEKLRKGLSIRPQGRLDG